MQNGTGRNSPGAGNSFVDLPLKKEYFLDCAHPGNCVLLIYNFIMLLMLYIGNDLIESVKLDSDKIPKPGYLGQFKRVLKNKYQDLIKQHPEPPDFLVVDPNPLPTDKPKK